MGECRSAVDNNISYARLGARLVLVSLVLDRPRSYPKLYKISHVGEMYSE